MLPSLALVMNRPRFAAVIAERLRPAFDRIVTGVEPADFASLHGTTQPLVVVVGSASADLVLTDLVKHRPINWVHCIFAGLDTFSLHLARSALRGVPVTNAKGVYSAMLAEHCLLSMLYFTRQVSKLQENRKNKIWDRFGSTPLAGRTVGIIGYGDIGRECARVLAPFRMTVLGLKRSLKSDAASGSCPVDDLGSLLVTGESGMQRICQESDFILAALPLTEATRNSIGSSHFEAMRPRRPVFINIGRGATVCEESLLRALQSDGLRGAALDVFATEPLPDESPFWQLGDDRLLLTPHSADINHTMEEDAAAQFVGLASTWAKDGFQLPIDAPLVNLEQGY